MKGDRLATRHLAKSCSLRGETQRVSCGGSTAQQKWLLAQKLRDPRAVIPPQTHLSSLCRRVKLVSGVGIKIRKGTAVALALTSCIRTNEEGITVKVWESSPG